MFPMPQVPTARRTTDDLPRALAAAAIAITLAGVLVASVAYFTSNPIASGGSAEPIAAQDVRDGWSSYLGAAAERPVSEVVDGWSSYLTPHPPAVVDGWTSYLLVDEIDPNTVVDGWTSRYGGRDE